MLSTGGNPELQAAKFAQLYGKFEARIRVPKGQRGSWPAFWLKPDPWPVHDGVTEIDIAEWFSKADGVYHTVTHRGAEGEPVYQSLGMYPMTDIDQWHVYGVEWLPERVAFFVDGNEVARTEQNVPDVPMYILLNLAVDAGALNFPHEAPDDSTIWPLTMGIDWVRVYEWLE
jgi:beta-glucanase (GH16 family)